MKKYSHRSLPNVLLSKRFLIVLFYLILILFSGWLFSPGFSTYFHQDDFLHFQVSSRWDQVVGAFNLFSKGEFPFYRPLSTQVYFFFGRLLFNLNPLGYHLVNYLIFSTNTILIYFLVNKLLLSKKSGMIASIFYSVNATHIAPLFSGAYVHELLYVFFALLTVVCFVNSDFGHKKSWFGLCMLNFILSLLSKENAVIIPGILAISYLFFYKHSSTKDLLKIISPYAVILIVYLFGHTFFYGFAHSPSYQFAPGIASIKMLGWYFIWAFSAPNILIDFVQSHLRLSNLFFEITKSEGAIWLFLFISWFFLMLANLILGIKKKLISGEKVKIMYFGLVWFVLGLIPLIVFPNHKLATQQAFSLVGLSIVIVQLLFLSENLLKLISFMTITVYLMQASIAIRLAPKIHWIPRSAGQAKRTIEYLNSLNPPLSERSEIYFKDGVIKIPQYGSSRQIHQSLGEGVALSIIFPKYHLTAYYEYQYPQLFKSIPDGSIIVDASTLLGY